MKTETLRKLGEFFRAIADMPTGAGGRIKLDDIVIDWLNKRESMSGITFTVDGKDWVPPTEGTPYEVPVTHLDISGVAVSEENAETLWKVIELAMQSNVVTDEMEQWTVCAALNTLGLYVDTPVQIDIAQEMERMQQEKEEESDGGEIEEAAEPVAEGEG
jgi:hypothetical protein